MADNNDTQNDDENNDTAAELPPMTLPEIQAALNDESHPRHEEARRHNADAAKKLAPALQKYRESVASQVNVDEIFKQFHGQHDAARMREFVSPAPYEFPKHPATDVPSLAHTELMDGMKEAMQARANRERRQDDTAEASLETMQAVAAQMQKLNEKMAEVDERLESGNTSATSWNRWVLAIATLTLIATVIGIFT